MINGEKIKLLAAIVGIFAPLFGLVYALWSNKISGLIMVLYSAVYILFVAVIFLFLKVYENRKF